MDAKKRAVSKLQSSKSKANLFRVIKIISIRHKGKIPKKTYVLNVRKIYLIIQVKRHRKTSNDNFAQNNAFAYLQLSIII